MKTIQRTRLVKIEGEWVVQAFDQNGKRYPEADYFTNDKEDAIGTAKLMVNPKTPEAE